MSSKVIALAQAVLFYLCNDGGSIGGGGGG
jgi:hypothetical protein